MHSEREWLWDICLHCKNLPLPKAFSDWFNKEKWSIPRQERTDRTSGQRERHWEEKSRHGI